MSGATWDVAEEIESAETEDGRQIIEDGKMMSRSQVMVEVVGRTHRQSSIVFCRSSCIDDAMSSVCDRVTRWKRDCTSQSR